MTEAVHKYVVLPLKVGLYWLSFHCRKIWYMDMKMENVYRLSTETQRASFTRRVL